MPWQNPDQAQGQARKGRGKRKIEPSPLFQARKIAMYLVYQYSGIGNNEIGELFGGIHYSAVSKAVSRLKQEMRDDNDLECLVERIKSHVKT